ncbi:MAG: hypothetical protein ACKVPX_13945 [Myxococcaceae bacterium]
MMRAVQKRLARLGWGALALVSVQLSCIGPQAPDAVICQDVAARLCRSAGCTAVAGRLPGSDCAALLVGQAGCGTPDYAFTSPERERVLSCRITLMRSEDDAVLQCQAAADFLEACADVAAVYGVAP